MRIAIVTQYYSPEAIRIPDTLARELSVRGHEVRVITGYPNYPDGKLFPGYKLRLRSEETIDGVRVKRVPLLISHSYNPVARFTNYLTFALSAALARPFIKSADIVYVYATQMTPAIGPSIWRRFFGIPYVMHVQDLWPESVTGSSMLSGGLARRVIEGLLNPWLRYLYRTAAGTIAIAPSMARMLTERGVPASKIHTVLNWATDEPEHASDRPNEDFGLSIVYAGNLGDHQDLETLVRAADRVKDDADVRLTIVGSGVAERGLRALVRELNAFNVSFKGRVPPEEMSRIHAASHFQVVSLKDLPIFEGTIPSKFQASLAQGVPVITTVRGDVKKFVGDNGIGYACEPENVEDLAALLRRAAASTATERQEMGQSARDFYLRTMAMSHGVDEIEKILMGAANAAGKTKGKCIN